MDLMQSLMAEYTSDYARRIMAQDTLEGCRAAQAVEHRLRDCVSFPERSRNRRHVPFSQAGKAIVYLCSGVRKPVWAAERKARRIVGREYAVGLLHEIARCRRVLGMASQCFVFVT